MLSKILDNFKNVIHWHTWQEVVLACFRAVASIRFRAMRKRLPWCAFIMTWLLKLLIDCLSPWLLKLLSCWDYSQITMFLLHSADHGLEVEKEAWYADCKYNFFISFVYSRPWCGTIFEWRFSSNMFMVWSFAADVQYLYINAWLCSEVGPKQTRWKWCSKLERLIN